PPRDLHSFPTRRSSDLLKALEDAQHLLGWLAVCAVRHQFGIAQDGVERRAQLMAHVGEELRLVLARLLKLPALILYFVEQPHIRSEEHTSELQSLAYLV